MVLLPALFLIVLEIGLRVAGIGHPTSFFLHQTIQGKDYLVENDRFGWRFFGSDMARSPLAMAVPKVKPPDTMRVFVFGESAALGDPQPEFGLGRMLQALLEGRYPDKHFEVISTAMTAINSHVIRPIAKECAAHHGDVWVVYMGNNEVVGPYGSGTVFGGQTPSLPVIRASIALKGSYVGQLLETLLRRAHSKPLNQSEWGGMEMFSHNHVRSDDPRMAMVCHSFERNLIDIVDTGLEAGAKVVVSTVARNLKDCGPFASDHRPDWSNADAVRWDGFFQAALAARQAGRSDEAIAALQQAVQLDGTFAEARYRLGQCLLDAGRDADAAREFVAACDQDTLRFRADSRINDLIRRVATERQRRGVFLVDSESAVNSRSSHALAGSEFLYEHVHLNFSGNYLLARAIAEQIESTLPQPGKNTCPTEADCARRLGCNDFMRRDAVMQMFARCSDAPFNTQADNQRQSERLRQQVEQHQFAALPAALQEDVAQVKAVITAHPDDWVLLRNLANLQEQVRDFAAASESLRRVTQWLPHNADAWQAFGQALAAARKSDDAIAAFQTALRLQPESVVSLNSLAELHAATGHTELAEREFREVVRRKPYWSPAHFGLGKILEAAGRTNEGNEQFNLALQDRLLTPASVNALAAMCVSKGWFDRAVQNYTDSLRLAPADPATHFNLGFCFSKLGRNTEAKAEYQEAIRLEPDYAEPHCGLGLVLGRAGDPAGATAEFSEAVRLKPDFPEARLNLGIALSKQQRNQEALEQFQEALRRDPNNPVALKFLKALRTQPSSAKN